MVLNQESHDLEFDNATSELIQKKINQFLGLARRRNGVPISIVNEFDRYFWLGAEGLLFHGTARSFGFSKYRGPVEARLNFLQELLEEPIKCVDAFVSLATLAPRMFNYGAGGHPFLTVDGKKVEKLHGDAVRKDTPWDSIKPLPHYGWDILGEDLDPRTVETIFMTGNDYRLVKKMYGSDFANRRYCNTDKPLPEIIHPVYGRSYVWTAIKPFLVKGILLSLPEAKAHN